MYTSPCCVTGLASLNSCGANAGVICRRWMQGARRRRSSTTCLAATRRTRSRAWCASAHQQCSGLQQRCSRAPCFAASVRKCMRYVQGVGIGLKNRHQGCLLPNRAAGVQACGCVRRRFQAELGLSIHLDDSIHTLSDGLDRYFASERIEGANQWECPECNANRRASAWALATAPNTLIVSLKRFDARTLRKVTRHVAFPVKLSLAPYLVHARVCPWRCDARCDFMCMLPVQYVCPAGCDDLARIRALGARVWCCTKLVTPAEVTFPPLFRRTIAPTRRRRATR
jgi:hypothetical protein